MYKQGGALYDTCNCQINHDKTHLFFTSCIGLHVCMCCQIRLNFTHSSSRISAVFPIISQSKQTISKSNHIIMLRKFSFKAQLFSSYSFWQSWREHLFMSYQRLLTLSSEGGTGENRRIDPHLNVGILEKTIIIFGKNWFRSSPRLKIFSDPHLDKIRSALTDPVFLAWQFWKSQFWKLLVSSYGYFLLYIL